MPGSSFTDKFIEKIDRIDTKRVENYILRLAAEKGFFEDIFTVMAEGVIVTDESSQIIFANRATHELFGMFKETQMREHLDEFFQVLGVVNERGKAIRSFKQAIREIELFYPRAMVLNVSITPRVRDGRMFLGYVIIVRDVTERKIGEKQMFRERRIAAMTALSAGLAHEVGNPLNSVHIHLQLMEREIKSVKGAARQRLNDLLRVVKEEVQRLDTITENFLRAVRPRRSRLEAGNINETIEAALEFMIEELSQKNIIIKKDYSKAVPSIMLDKGQIRQAFLNIIKNTVAAMPGGGTFSVQTEFNGIDIKIFFADTGVGIPKDKLSRVFEPYYTTRKDGSGLGLMIVHRVITEHGGDIEIRSKEGEGTTVVITLPAIPRKPRLLPQPVPDARKGR